MPKHLKKRLIAIGCLVAVGASLMVILAAKANRPPFGFITSMGGHRTNLRVVNLGQGISMTFPSPTTEGYAFSATPREVEAKMSAELRSKAWATNNDTPTAAVFRRTDEKVYFVLGSWGPNLGSKATCYVFIERKRAWLDEMIRKVQNCLRLD